MSRAEKIAARLARRINGGAVSKAHGATVTADMLMPFAVTIVRAEDEITAMETAIAANGERISGRIAVLESMGGAVPGFSAPLTDGDVRGDAETLIAEVETYLATEAR